MTHPLLVAPAGTLDIVDAALAHGADAVYVGVGPHNLRARAPNLTVDQLAQALERAHVVSRELYVVLNTMPDDRQAAEIERVVDAVAALDDRPDAVVASDPGVMEICRDRIGDVAVHLSTQTGTFNLRSARFWQRQGVSRFVLPREMTLEQVRVFADGGVDTEVFVHGAMCVSVSGRCLLGAYLSGRNANQGDCPQPCRYRYRLRVLDADGEAMPPASFEAEEDGKGTYLLNSRDLNTLAILDRVVAAGVSALKIEGRNKSVHYVSSVVKSYRSALDRVLETPGRYEPDPAWVDQLEHVDHRPYTTGFYDGEQALQAPEVAKAMSRSRVVAVVKATMGTAGAVLDVKNPFEAGERLNVLPVRRGAEPYATVFAAVRNFDGALLDRAVTNRVVVVESDPRLAPGDIVRRLDTAPSEQGVENP